MRNKQRQNRYWLTISLFVCQAPITTNTDAVEQSMQLKTSAQLEHVDNVLLVRDPKDYLASTILSQYVDYKAYSSTWDGTLTLFGNLRSTSDPDFDSNDYGARAHLNSDWRQSNLGIELSSINTTVRQVEVSEVTRINNDPVTTNTLGYDWTTKLSAKDSINISGQALKRQYTSNAYTDYLDFSGALLWQRHISPITSIQGQVYYGHYMSDRVDFVFPTVPTTFYSTENNTTTMGLQIGVIGYLSENLTYNLLAGGSKVNVKREQFYFLGDDLSNRFSNNSFDETTDNGIISTTLNYGTPRSKSDVSFSKGLQASSNGFQYDSEEFKLYNYYRFSANWGSHVNLSYKNQSSLDINSALTRFLDRELYDVDLMISRRLSQHWKISIRAHYIATKYKIYDDAAESLTGSLKVTYVPNEMKW